VEHRSVSVHLRDKLLRVERFLYGNLLWSRSVPRPIVPRLSDMADAFRWLTSERFRRSVTGGGPVEGPEIDLGDLLIVLLVVLMLALRRRMQRRLAAIGEQVADPAVDRFQLTLEALFHTVLLAAPLPLILYLGGEILGRAQGSTYLASAAEALGFVAAVAALLEWLRQHNAPHGLAEAHFGWPAKITRPIHRGMIWPELVSLPVLYVALQLAMAGIRLSSPQALQIYNNSVGRVAFIIATVVLGISILSMLRPERKFGQEMLENQPFWKRTFSSYAFPLAFYWAYPMVMLGTIVPAVLAVFGFYVTGLLLAYQMLGTIWVVLGTLLLGGLLHRWRATSASRAKLSEDDEDLSIVDEKEAETADARVRQLSRFAVILVAAMGLYTVWSEALPMLEVMKRIQIWPRIEVTERVGVRDLTMTDSSGQQAAAETVPGGESSPVPSVPGVPTLPADGAVESVESSPLTLWVLFEALLAALITLVLARNLPGLLELILKRRTTLDNGARVAFSTLIRYSITLVGVSVVFSVLGVSWSKVQWLAAALTFGLGFGLQEIVANFVSGLILLVERPVRVGDVVTVGNLMGAVTRIQIRATTITLWDRSEMIVPNRDFITTKLVNWTLSDSKRRIEIPLRIAYGADLQLVRETLVEAAAQHPDVLEDPPPHCLLLDFGDDAIKFELRFVVDFGKGLATKDQVQMEIDRRFREQSIEFALPRSEIRVISDSG
jgi:potassium efflux system protein